MKGVSQASLNTGQLLALTGCHYEGKCAKSSHTSGQKQQDLGQLWLLATSCQRSKKKRWAKEKGSLIRAPCNPRLSLMYIQKALNLAEKRGRGETEGETQIDCGARRERTEFLSYRLLAT